MKYARFKKFNSLLLLGLITLPFPVFAAVCSSSIIPKKCWSAGGLDCSFCEFVTMVDNLVCYSSFYLILPAAVLALIMAGIMLVTALGNPQRLEKGKNIFKYAIWGLIIVLAAYLIIDSILGTLLKSGYKTWQTFPGCS